MQWNSVQPVSATANASVREQMLMQLFPASPFVHAPLKHS